MTTKTIYLPTPAMDDLRRRLLANLQGALVDTLADAGHRVSAVNHDALRAHGVDVQQTLTMVLGLGCDIWDERHAA